MSDFLHFDDKGALVIGGSRGAGTETIAPMRNMGASLLTTVRSGREAMSACPQTRDPFAPFQFGKAFSACRSLSWRFVLRIRR
ncbi:hypothetical protein H0I76_03405 [Limibaculum sp. M0105]|uniref:Uncharacterized protein n=1 Tax=Thermohalobaculum xanthum TaxID=2753746 RepID=A0A8J7SF38_9RHOB|nr:hypothetical protein [Thermohalobaculum xanthum]MBK0398225.1 hypothetical protein [Thermohalobaculum xanthum]